MYFTLKKPLNLIKNEILNYIENCEKLETN